MVIKNKNLLVFGSLGLIILGIALASVINRVTSSANPSSDVRARAATAHNLKIHATVDVMDELAKTLTVNDIYFAEESRSGEAKNLGSWIVTVPVRFSFATISPGTNVAIEVNAKSFQISKHTISAISIKPIK